MKTPYEKGEIMRNAQRLIKSKGDKALGYAKRVAEKKKEAGAEKDQAFWERIAAQIELLISEPPQD